MHVRAHLGILSVCILLLFGNLHWEHVLSQDQTTSQHIWLFCSVLCTRIALNYFPPLLGLIFFATVQITCNLKVTINRL